MENEVVRQAKYIEELTYDMLPEEVIEHAKLIILDSIGVIAFGNSQMHNSGILSGAYPLIGSSVCGDKLSAVFMNGVAMVKNELDEGNQFAFGHPACHIIPALLMEAKALNSTPKEVITALVAAYETACRWGMAVTIRPESHVHGTSQTMGAAAAVASLRKLKAEEIEKAIALANSLPQTTTWNAAFYGNQVRNAYIGLSNCIGMSAVDMVEAGIDTSYEVLEDVWNNIAGCYVNYTSLIKNLGTEYLIMKNYFKVHSACRYVHAFADMYEKLKDVSYQDIERIDIETYSSALKLNKTRAYNLFAAKFSIPVSVAIYIVYGSLDAKMLTEDMLSDTKVCDLADKITVRENINYTRLLPAIRNNHMVIYMKDGSIREAVSSSTKGDYIEPFSQKEMEKKFCGLTSDIWSRDRQNKIIAYMTHFELQENLKDLYTLIGKDGDGSC